MQLTPTTMLLLGASPSSSVIAHHQPDTITGLHCHVPDQGRQCSHRRAYWHRAPAVACGLRSGLVFCPWHEACTHLQLAPPIVHLPSSTPVTGLHCHAPMWDPVAIVVHADRQGPHNCQCNCSWPWLLLPMLAATTICLQPAPTTTLSLVASLWSWVCVHHWLWPLPLLALISTCWTWRCFWYIPTALAASVDPPQCLPRTMQLSKVWTPMASVNEPPHLLGATRRPYIWCPAPLDPRS